MGQYRTSQGRYVTHCHLATAAQCPDRIWVLSAYDVERIRRKAQRECPGAEELGPPTYAYNCYGHALAGRHGYFLSPALFFADDFVDVPLDEPQIDDVAIYYNGPGPTLMHLAVVTEVSGNQITLLESKWGRGPELRHTPTNVPWEYGKIRKLKRRADRVTDLRADRKMMYEGIMSREVIERAISRLSEESVYGNLAFASSPEALRVFIELIPEVQSLISLGFPVKASLLEFFQNPETQNSEEKSAIALYLLQRLADQPDREAARKIADYMKEGKVLGMNREMAAQAFIANAGIEDIDGDLVSGAFRAAENFQ